MDRSLEKHIDNFLNSYGLEKGRIVLALSGGPDSMALYVLLRAACKKKGLELHVAHVDHGWRKESALERSYLKKLVEQDGVIFHSTTLPDDIPKTEEGAREARYTFFQKVAEEVETKVLFLGHHSDDLAETVFKRVSEGAFLTSLAAMDAETVWERITLYRPFLTYTKKELVAFLNKRQVPYFTDRTNGGEYCLRGKLRERVFPAIEEATGKKLLKSLNRLSQYGKELNEYLDYRVSALHQLGVKGPYGIFYDFSKVQELHPYELRYFIRKIVGQEGVVLPNLSLKRLVEAIVRQGVPHSMEHANIQFVVDRSRFFIVKTSLRGACKQQLERGYFYDWLDIWRGKKDPKKERFYNRSRRTILKKMSSEKVPVFLRESLIV